MIIFAVILGLLAGLGLWYAGTHQTNAAGARSVAEAATTKLAAGDIAGYCALAVPAQVQSCLAGMSTNGTQISTHNVAVGAVEVQGNEALFVTTGTFCVQSQCKSNSNSRAGLDGTMTFNQVYALEVSPTQQGPAWVTGMVAQNGKWYLTGFYAQAG